MTDFFVKGLKAIALRYADEIDRVTVESECATVAFKDLKVAYDFVKAYAQNAMQGVNVTRRWEKADICLTALLSKETLARALKVLDESVDKARRWKEDLERNSAKTAFCIEYPTDPLYVDETTRRFQGCPSIAVTKKGRIFAAWYSGGVAEPHPDNFTLLVYSDDSGKTWSKPVFVALSNRDKGIHAMDMQLYVEENGSLSVYFSQQDFLFCEAFENNYGCYFYDTEFASWRTQILEPDKETLTFTPPQYCGMGLLRNKPVRLSTGRTLKFPYDMANERYALEYSDDDNRFTRVYGGKKRPTPFDETMAYERSDGSIRMLARTAEGVLAESLSFDGGATWTDGAKTDIRTPNSRFFVSKTPSGKVILITNDHDKERTALTVFLSEDDGTTWKRVCLIDDRPLVSYPDADFYGGKIYLIYDRERHGAKEILFTLFTEAELLQSDFKPEIHILSKP
ncbi:MAG: exo-alpha-sialidase [Clostridia bacterium]|nr:exo-alpha-sialidase [Clostridia bacterium]